MDYINERMGKTMKNRRILCVLAILAALAVLFCGCAKKAENGGDGTTGGWGGGGGGGGEGPSVAEIDDNGFWKGIKALDYVELFEYKALPVPSEVHRITDDALQTEINGLLAEYSTPIRVTDRAVKDGDRVNIDYVGSVDGVEFEGGSTEGAGTDVTAGSTDYIDDFLSQIIGHMPGETIDVKVTFPENYGQDHLNGKDALFVTTINYIDDYIYPTLTDDFVASTFSADHGWNTVDELKQGILAGLQKEAIYQYITKRISEAKVKNVPDVLLKYQQNNMVEYYQTYAGYYGMELEEFLKTVVGVSDIDELMSKNYEANISDAKHGLVLQAIAEDGGFSVVEEDVKNYFVTNMGTDDYSGYAEQYGMPYLKQFVLYQKVLQYIADNAVLK